MTTQTPPEGMGKGITIALIVVMLLLAAIPLLVLKGAAFGGADNAASALVAQLAPHYDPTWIRNIWTPPGAETESMLFALQAAAGGLLIGYLFGYKRAENRFKGNR